MFKHNSQQDLNGQLQVDVNRLAQEALKDLIKEYRLLKNSKTAIPSSVADADALNVPYDLPSNKAN